MKLDGDKHSIRKKDMPNLEDLYLLTICQFYIKELPKRKNIVQPYYTYDTATFGQNRKNRLMNFNLFSRPANYQPISQELNFLKSRISFP